MLKVIIADDEERVCRLIMKLVDWEALDMEVSDTAHNGIEALDMVKKHKPDLIITDIRMPGYDGLEMIMKAKELKEDLEFIIISGYGQFEYAQKAIKYGVSDYLLKPIQKVELTNTLEKLGEKLKNIRGQLSSTELHEIRTRTDLESRRINFMRSFFSEDGLEDLSELDEFNSFYGLNLVKGYSQILVMKIDAREKIRSEEKEIIEEKIRIILDETFSEYNLQEREVYLDDQMVVVFLHFPEEKREDYLRRGKELLHLFKEEISLLKNRTLTMGQGHVAKSLSELSNSYETAVLALEDSYVKGVGKVYYREDSDSVHFIIKDEVYEFFALFEKHLSMLDQEGVRKLLIGMKEKIIKDENVSGHEVLHLTKEICNLYSFTMLKNKFSLAESSTLMDQFESSIRYAQSIDEVFLALEKKILQSMEDVIRNKKETLSKPIRDAKKYMEDNYMGSLSLDEVSRQAGFTSSYFSALFKKETGISFIDHLTEIRINNAKELLKDKDLRIMDICEMVGYSDVKYFTRSFIKRTGLKPNEYRKIYS